MPEHLGMDLEPNLGFVAGAGEQLGEARGVNGPPRSEAKAKDEADWRFSSRSAPNSSPKRGMRSFLAAFGAPHVHRGGLELDR
jgi:hypothetical protein